MVLKIFICPSHIANWIPGALESMGHDRHPISTFGSVSITNKWHMKYADMDSFENDQLERPYFVQNIT